MRSPIRVTTKVLAGNKIEIEVPEAEIGDTVDVLVTLSGKTESKRRSAVDIINELPGQQLLKTTEEADKYIQKEGESWD